MSAENYVDRVVAPDGVTYIIVDIDAQERIARLEAAYGVNFTEQPEDQTVAVGETAIFNVAVSNENVTYQWQVKTGSAAEWQNTQLDVEHEDTLSFTAIAGYNNRRFRCLVQLPSGYQAASYGALLKVTEQQPDEEQPDEEQPDEEQPDTEQDENP